MAGKMASPSTIQPARRPRPDPPVAYRHPHRRPRHRQDHHHAAGGSRRRWPPAAASPPWRPPASRPARLQESASTYWQPPFTARWAPSPRVKDCALCNPIKPKRSAHGRLGGSRRDVDGDQPTTQPPAPRREVRCPSADDRRPRPTCAGRQLVSRSPDLIDAGAVPVARLATVHRQAHGSRILEACDLVRAVAGGTMPRRRLTATMIWCGLPGRIRGTAGRYVRGTACPASPAVRGGRGHVGHPTGHRRHRGQRPA